MGILQSGPSTSTGPGCLARVLIRTVIETHCCLHEPSQNDVTGNWMNLSVRLCVSLMLRATLCWGSLWWDSTLWMEEALRGMNTRLLTITCSTSRKFLNCESSSFLIPPSSHMTVPSSKKNTWYITFYSLSFVAGRVTHAHPQNRIWSSRFPRKGRESRSSPP